MEHLIKKTHTTSRSLTYTYYRSPPRESDSSRPTLLFCHGFPDGAHLWATVSAGIADLPFPVLIPDLLGYGETSKPTDAALYNSASMVADVISLLDAEHFTSIIAIGHDWGSYLVQRIYLYHPSRVVGLVLMTAAYTQPSPTPFNLDTMLDITEKNIGYPLYAYWQLFTAEDGPAILEAHLESFWTGLHGDKKGLMRDLLCTRGALREYLLADKRVSVKAYARDGKVKEEWTLSKKKGGFSGPLCWYKAMAHNHHYVAERAIPEERFKVRVPMLYIGAAQDAVNLPAMMDKPAKQGLLPDLTKRQLESGHWLPMEKPKEVEEVLREWLGRFQGNGAWIASVL